MVESRSGRGRIHRACVGGAPPALGAVAERDGGRPLPARRRPGASGPADRGRLCLGVAFLTLVVVGTDLFVVSPLLPSISHDDGVTPGTAGAAVTVFSLAYVVAAPWFGAVADRIGRRTVLVAGLLGFAVANLLTGLSPGFGVLLAARLLAGLAAGAVSPSVFALVAQVAPARRRAAWMSTAVAGLLVALVTGAPSGTLLASALGWRAVFLLLAPLSLILAWTNRSVWPSAAGTEARRPGDGGAGLLTRLRAVSVAGLWGFAVYTLYTYLGTGLRDAGLSTGSVALALVLYGAGAVAGSLGGGRLADRHGPGRIASLSLVLLSVAQVCVDLFLDAPTPVLLVLLALFAVTAYACIPSHQARLVSRFPTQSGSFLAWTNSALYLGTSVGSAAGGALLSTAGFRSIPLVGAAAGLLGALASACWAIPRGLSSTESTADVRPQSIGCGPRR